jgi:HSP20 family protein
MALIPFGRRRGVARFEDHPMVAFQREMNRLFDEMFGDLASGFAVSPVAGGTPLWPRIEIKDEEKQVVVSADLPGLTPEEVKLELKDGVLTLSGEKKGSREDKTYSERWYGAFSRAIEVGDVDAEKASAEFKNGVLTITLPKRAETAETVKRIAIKAA